MAQFDDLMGIVIDTEDKFLNRKLNENICYFGPFAAAIGGSLIGGGLSYLGAKKQADATKAAANAQMAPFKLKEPYLEDMYQGAQGAAADMIAQGPYTGPYYAGLDPLGELGLLYQAGTALGNTGYAQDLINMGAGSFGNYQDIYNQLQGDVMAGANQYAMDNTQPLLAAAMRDPFRQLTEQTLPGISTRASASGNTNSSRAAIAEGIANRAFDDRMADTSANITNQLRDDYLSQFNTNIGNQMAATNAMMKGFGTGLDLQNYIGNALMKSGAGFQTDLQGQYDADKAMYDYQAGFPLGVYGTLANIYGDAPSVGQIPVNQYDPTISGLSGAMAGYGFGKQAYNDYMNYNNNPGGGGGGSYTTNYGFNTKPGMNQPIVY